MEHQWWGTKGRVIHASVDGKTTVCKARMDRMKRVELVEFDSKMICERCAAILEENVSCDYSVS